MTAWQAHSRDVDGVLLDELLHAAAQLMVVVIQQRLQACDVHARVEHPARGAPGHIEPAARLIVYLAA
jgi:hypothetical protein